MMLGRLDIAVSHRCMWSALDADFGVVASVLCFPSA